MAENNDEQIKNLSEINKKLASLNKLYEDRITLLEKKLFNEENTSVSVVDEVDISSIVESDSNGTNMRISFEIKEALENIRLDFEQQYRRKLSLSQVVHILLKLYNN